MIPREVIPILNKNEKHINMKPKSLILLVAVLIIQCTLVAQTGELPVIKANYIYADIRADDNFMEEYWRIVPEIELDIYYTTAKKVTFYTDLDSISFDIDPKVGIYDFIILLSETDSAMTRIKYRKNSLSGYDKLMRHYTNSFDLFTIIATNNPENFNSNIANRGFRHSASYLIPFGKSNFSMGIGLGISWHNYYIDALPKDILPASMQEGRGEDFYFVKIDDIKIGDPSNPKDIFCKKNKVTLTYLDIPLEFRHCTYKGFKVSVGVKVDFLVGSRFKFKGSDFLFGTDEDIKVKKYSLDNISPIQFGTIARIGWKRFHAYTTYSFTPVYDMGETGKKLNPICVGVSFTPKY